MTPTELRALLAQARDQAIAELACLSTVSRHTAIASAAGPVHVIAVGKAAPRMFRDCEKVLDHRIERALVITTDSTDAGEIGSSETLLRAAHPIPDARSVEAASRALELAAQVPDDATLIVLVSGGASSLLCAPPTSMPLQDKQRVIDELLRSGAPIGDVNTVRRHLSRIKGGRLAVACRAQVLCSIESDVIGGAPHDVGSGPACEDPTSVSDAERVLMQALGEWRAREVLGHLSEGLSTRDARALRVDARIVLGPEDLAASLASGLARRGLRTSHRLVPSATAEELAELLHATTMTLEEGEAVVFAAEPAIRLPTYAGRGGRAGWVALRVLAEPGLRVDAAVLCASSDGVDGTSGASGACVSGGIAVEPGQAQAALRSYDDASVHARLGTHLKGGATGLNLTDVYVCARAG